MRKKARLVCAGCLSAGLHLFVVVPFGVTRLLIDTTPELSVSFIDADDGPGADAEAAPEEPDKIAPPRLAEAPRRPEPPKPEEPEEPAERKKKEKEEDKPAPPPLLVVPNAHLKMVDQEQFPDEEDNKDANYLSQKNHRAEKETRAEDTNLLRSQAGEKSSQESKSQAPQPGDGEQKIAELMDRPGDPKRLPANQMSQGETLEKRKGTARKDAPSPLSMRDVVRAQAEAKSRDGLELSEAGVGPLPLARQGAPKDGEQAPRTGARAKLELSHDDYERIVGFDVAQSERQAALSQRSKSSGRWEKVQQKMQMMRASLENFTPSVRPGNQSELGTRRHPFAAYIAGMHRQIHKLWGFGYLIELDGKPAGSPYNDMNLWTGLEITLTPDGAVEKLIIEHPSGNGVFDAAAMDVVMSAGPFGAPPEVIKSRDGKVYLSWGFHRDARQCATDFAHPHILTTPPKAAPGGAPVPSVPPAGEPRRPMLTLRPGALGQPEPKEPKAGRAARAAEPAQAAAVPKEAQEVAEKWLAAYEKGDARWLAGHSAVPFSAGGRTVAEDGPGLRAMYRQMVAEQIDRGGTLTYYTAAQIRKRLGKLPAGGDEEDMMFAMLKGEGDDIVLLLQPADKGWRVVGLAR